MALTRMKKVVVWTSNILTLTGLGCVETQFHDLNVSPPDASPRIVVSPTTVSFSPTAPGDTATEQVWVSNEGEAPLRITSVVSTDSAFFLTGSVPPILAPSEGFSMDVWFEGRVDSAPLIGELIVASDDEGQPEVVVPLTGSGLGSALRVAPNPVDIGSVYVTCEQLGWTTLSNVGPTPLTVTDIILDGDEEMSVRVPEIPFTLDPDESRQIELEYAPFTDVDHQAVLSVSSSDTADPVAVPVIGQGIFAGQQTDHFEHQTGIVDLLIAIDSSCSMGDQKSDIDLALQTLVADLEVVAPLWQVGVTTGNPCFTSGVITPSTPNYASVITNAARLSSYGVCDTECLLHIANTALGQDVPGGCNEGFLRPGALLHLLVISDEPEQSGISWSTLVNDLRGFVATDTLLLISAIVDLGTCGYGGAAGYLEAAAATGGPVLDVCDAAWADEITVVSEAIAEKTRALALSRSPAYAPSMEVLQDGVPASDWWYDPDWNAVWLDEPRPDSVFDITYSLLGACD